MSALFISYTGRDPEGEAWADRLTEWLAAWGYGYFRDKDRSHGICAGDDWRARLYQELGVAQALICLCSPEYDSSPWCVGEVAIAVAWGKTLIPLQLLLGSKPPRGEPLPALLQDRQAIIVANAANPSTEELEQVRLSLRRVLEEKLNWRALQAWNRFQPPYPGLLAFEAEQAPVFFGRDGEIERMREQLASLAQRSPAFLLLLGASGTGKSSLVRAGVVPRLASERQRWRVLAPFSPGPMPLDRLRQVLREAWDDLGQPPPSPQRGEGEEAALLRQLMGLHTSVRATVLVVVDQFEELLVVNQPEAEQFLRFLQTLLRQELGGVVLLATLRSDFLELLQSRWPQLVGLATTQPLQPIQPEDFSELIQGPAQRSGLVLQPGLQERLVNESGSRDALPLLAFTLEKLWRMRRERGVAVAGPNGARWDLTLADYEKLGGVAGVVGTLAALCWDPLTSEAADTKALKQAFVQHLVRLNEEGLATKQAARWGELPERSRPLIKRFVKERLLVSGGGESRDQVEIAHEALLRTWEPLVKWIDKDRKELEQRRRVARLCGDLALNQPLQARLAALQGLLTLAEADSWAVAPAVQTLGEVLTQSERDPREWPLAIRLLGPVGDQGSVAALGAFLEWRQLREPLQTERAAPLLKALCQAASALQDIHRRTPPPQ